LEGLVFDFAKASLEYFYLDLLFIFYLDLDFPFDLDFYPDFDKRL
jgi:hypothetical protein